MPTAQAVDRAPGWLTRQATRVWTIDDEDGMSPEVVVMPTVFAHSSSGVEEGTMAQPILIDYDSDHLVSPSPQLAAARRGMARGAAAAGVQSRASSRKLDHRQKAKNWVFTWNNPPCRPEERWTGWKYMVYQAEIAPTTGTYHYQGYVQMEERRSLVQMKKLDPRVHWAVARGNPDQNKAYCSKEDTRAPGSSGPWEFGVMDYQGQRRDLSEIAERVLGGTSMQVIARESPEMLVRYERGLRALRRLAMAPAIIRDVRVVLSIGPTGTGKTYEAVTNVDPNQLYIKNSDRWFDGYNGQSHVVFDDFAGAPSHIGLTEVLRMFDKYRYQCEIKGGFEWLEATHITVTTNIHPMNWYKYNGRVSQYFALVRRFSEVRVFRHLSPTSNEPKIVVIKPGTPDWELFWQGLCPSMPARPDGEDNSQLAERLAADAAAAPWNV